MHALPGFVLGHLARVLQEFQARYPQIVLDMIVNDAAIDPVKEGFDCALQIFPPRSEELVSKKLFPVRRVFCASPEYLKRHGTPRGPRDLTGHRIGWYSGYPTRERLAFHGPGPSGLARDHAGAADQQRAPAARVRARARRHRLPADAGRLRRRALRGDLQVVLPEHQLSVVLALGVLSDHRRGSLKLKLFLEHARQRASRACRRGTRR